MSKPTIGRPYAEGRRKPPKEHQFKKGQSGNPSGRPKGSRNDETELKEELAERVSVSEGGKNRKYSKRRLMWKSLTNKAARGDVKASELVMKAEERFASRRASEPGSAPLPEEDEAIVMAYFLKLKNKGFPDPEAQS